jgi:hypothetical protein
MMGHHQDTWFLSGKPKRETPHLSFWEMLELECKLGLMQWANSVKQRMVGARRREQELDRQNLLLAGGRLWPQRLTSGARSLPETTRHVEWEISDREVEQLALRAVTRFSRLEPDEAEQAWADWKQELQLRLPPYAAEEAIRRADELRGLLL